MHGNEGKSKENEGDHLAELPVFWVAMVVLGMRVAGAKARWGPHRGRNVSERPHSLSGTLGAEKARRLGRLGPSGNAGHSVDLGETRRAQWSAVVGLLTPSLGPSSEAVR